MTLYGHVKDGAIVLDEQVSLPEGVAVRLELLPDQPHAESEAAQKPTGNVWEALRALAGTVEGPPDWARNHDHYLYGTPKRE